MCLYRGKCATVSRMNSDNWNADAPDSNLVCIFRTGDEEFIAVVKSILDGEGIQYVARNADPPDLFGVGHVGRGFSFAAGAVDFMVSPGDAARVRVVLDALRRGFLTGGAAESKEAEEP